MMSYVVAQILKMRPLTIMKEWSCEELLVTFGYYMNQKAHEEYTAYLNADSEGKKAWKVKPSEYVITFITYDQLNELAKPKTQADILEERKREMMIETFMKGGGSIG